MTPRALVTGGAGFLGSHLCESLAKTHSVVVLDDFSTGREENLAAVAGRVEVIRGSITDPATVATAVRDCNVVFHLAAMTSVVDSVANPARCSRINMGGTANVLEASVHAGVRRFVLASSAAVYGDAGDAPVTEDLPPRPLSPYAISKVAGESLCLEFGARASLEAVVLRFFNIYGPRQRADSPYASVMPRFIDVLRSGGRPTIFGDGAQTRDFLHVDDATQAYMLAGSAPESLLKSRVYNVGTGNPTTVNAVADLLGRLAGSREAPEHAPARPGEIRHSCANITRAKGELGFVPRVPLADGLARLWGESPSRPG